MPHAQSDLLTAFHPTEQDVAAAMDRAGRPVDLASAEALFAAHIRPQAARVSLAALFENDLDAQTAAAQTEIAAILRERRVL